MQIVYGKNIDFDELITSDWQSEYLLASAKSSNTPYKMISQCPKETPLDDL